MNTKNLDYKWISICIGMMVLFSGIGYGMGALLPYLLPNDITENHCNDLNETSWNSSPIGKNYKTLEAYQTACKNIIHSIKVDQPKEIQIILTVACPAFIGFTFFIVFGIHKRDNEQPSNRSEKQ